MDSAQHASYQSPLTSFSHPPRESRIAPQPDSEPPARSSSNASRSYAARAAERPDLFLDTSPPQPADLAQSPASQDDLYNPPVASAATSSRKAAVPGRSPLQNLERSMSKEERRAQLQQAESIARQRSNGSRNSAAWPSGSRQAPQSSELQKPLPRAPVSPTGSWDPSHQRVRSYGYDSSLTGGAAAAAVGAYQASKTRYNDPLEQNPTYATHATSRSVSGPAAPAYSSSAAYPQVTAPTQRPTSQSRAYNEQPVVLDNPYASGFAQTEPLPPEPMGSGSDMHEPQYISPPSTAAGKQPRKQVAFHASSYEHEPQDRRRLRDLFYREHPEARRYQASNYLNEWEGSQAVVLTAHDLDLDTDSRAWWERNGQVQPPERGDLTQPLNGFQPVLNLTCGPLLRYTGIARDPETEKEYWRGSIMIVTEDAISSYQTHPTIRLFKQPMELVPTPQRKNDTNGPQQSYVSSDPIVGATKVSRTGHTLYVKPTHNLHSELDLSQMETDEGLFSRIAPTELPDNAASRISPQDGEKLGKFREATAFRLHAERGFTFWRFNIQVELTSTPSRIAYRINRGATVAFWVPAKGQSMNVAFHSCNGFSLSVDSNEFCGPDPLWRDVLNTHQFRPFHCLIGGGDQIYNDAAMKQTQHFQAWLALRNPDEKHSADFTPEMQEELEQFYFHRYAMWFSQGLFGMANSQIPMVNIWDDHDIIDGFGSYPHHFMSTPVFSGIGAVAFKYYMLFQHQSLMSETEQTEPSWLLGASLGPYIHELSRSVFLSLGKGVTFLGLDCRTERKRDEVLSQETYDLVFDRCRREIEIGETKHLIVLLGVPIAYPRLNFLENVLTSRALDPIKALGRAGILGNFLNKFDGGVEILDDLDDHWTAKHHKSERNWFIEELQELAAEKSVRITILGGDVHLAAVGQFYSNPKLGVPKDHDHRYMPNIISSAIVNTPPPEMMADVLNKRNKTHHLNRDTDENMIALFLHDVNGKSRNNQHLLPRRNWCAIRVYEPGSTPPPSPPPEAVERPSSRRSFSFSRSRSRSRTRTEGEKPGFFSRLSNRKNPPSSYRNPTNAEDNNSYGGPNYDQRVDAPVSSSGQSDASSMDDRGRPLLPRSNSLRLPTGLSRRASLSDRSGRQGHIDLQDGLDIVINCEIDQKDPAGFTVPYRLIIPALFYQDQNNGNAAHATSGIGGFFGSFRRDKQRDLEPTEGMAYESTQTQPLPPMGGRANPNGNIALAGVAAGVGAGAISAASTQSYQGQSFVQPSQPLSQSRGQRSAADPQIVSYDGAAPQTAETQPNYASQQLFGEVPTTRSSQARNINAPLPASATAAAPSSYRPVSNGTSEQDVRRISVETPRGDLNQRSASTHQVRPRAPLPPRRLSASGPPLPSNIDQLPASVRKRYEMLNDPAVNENLQRAEVSRQRYSQLNDPSGYKRYSQYEPFSTPQVDSHSQAQAQPQPQPQLQDQPQPRSPTQPQSRPLPRNRLQKTPPRPAPPPQPEDTHRRFSTGPMEMPLLPTNINQLRTSTHRTLQDTDARWDDPAVKRSSSAPAQNRSASAAYHKAQLAKQSDPTQPNGDIINTQSNNRDSMLSIDTSGNEANSRPVSTAVAPIMIPLSRGQARKSSEIPAYPSPLASHSTKDMDFIYDEPRNHAMQPPQPVSRGLGVSEPAPSNRNTSAPTRSLGRDHPDEAYGYRGSYEGPRSSSLPPRHEWGEHRPSGVPDKVARHFGGFDPPTSSGAATRYSQEYDYGYDDDGRRQRGLSGVFRRMSSRRRQREYEREEREQKRYSGYSDQFYDAYENHPEHHDDHDDDDDVYYEYDDRRSSWKFWQR